MSGYPKKHTAGNLTMEKINYNFNSQFYYFPVVNISYEDAVAYCEWRTKIVTDRYNQEKGFSKDSQEYTIFKFRLPSKKEWLKCASFGTDTITYPHLFTKTDINTTIHKKSLSFLRLLGAKITENNIIEFNKFIDFPEHENLCPLMCSLL